MLDVVTLAAFAVIACVVFVFARMVFKLQQNPIRERLAGAGPAQAIPGGEPPNRLMESLAAQLPEAPFDNGELGRDLRRAGYYKPSARKQFLAIRNALAILIVLAAAGLAVWIGPERQDAALRVAVGGLIAALAAWSLPRVLLALRARRRVERIRNALPDAMDMVSMCLAGGLPIQDSLAHVSREIYPAHPDLAVEMSIIRQQTEMNSLSFAFQQFAERIDTEETVTLASLIAQNQRLGTSVADAVRDFADALRLKRRQLADEHAGKAQWKLLFPIVLCLVPSVLILLWGPGILEIWKFFQSMGGPMTPAP